MVTMNQNGFSIADKMNIHCSAVIANQSDREEISNRTVNNFEQKMITTPTRGVGLNRNIALLGANADIVLFADDDAVYSDDMPQKVVEAFNNLPDADVIIFGLDMVKGGEIYERRTCKRKRLRVWNSMRYGTCRMAVRRKALIDNNIMFHQSFGGGCEFSSGEDSLFLKKCFDSGLKVYSYDYTLGTCCKDNSTWFKGYNEKYFYDRGVLLRKLFPKTAYLMALYFGICFKRETELNALKRLRLIYLGIRQGKNMIPYNEKYEENHYC